MFAEQVVATRHIVKVYGKYAMGMERVNAVASCTRGYGADWNGKSGNCEGDCKRDRAGSGYCCRCFAARNSRRLNRTIQIADTGIIRDRVWGIIEMNLPGKL